MNEPAASDRRRWVISLLLLTCATGLVDAASVLGLGHVFTGNMTGNLLFVGFSLAGANDVSIVASLLAVGGFVAGATWGGRIVRKRRHRCLQCGFAIELALLLAALAVVAAGDHGPLRDRALLVLLATALGLQGALAREVGASGFTTVVLTSTLIGAAVDGIAEHAGAESLRRGAAIGAMVAGAVFGGLLLRNGLAWPIAAAALLVTSTLSVSWRVVAVEPSV